MKKLALGCILVLQLSGCAVWDAYTMAHFDSVEYALLNNIRTKSTIAISDCGDQKKSETNATSLYNVALELKNYSQYIPNNTEAHKLSENIAELTKQNRELYAKGNVSEVFCKMKLQQINRSTETAQIVIGKKPR